MPRLLWDQVSCMHPKCVVYNYFHVFDDVVSPVFQLYLDMKTPYADDQYTEEGQLSSDEWNTRYAYINLKPFMMHSLAICVGLHSSYVPIVLRAKFS